MPNIIARVSNPDHEEAFKEVGIDNVISPKELPQDSRKINYKTKCC